MPLDKSDNFFTVASGVHTAEIKIKGSRFIAHVLHAAQRQNAETEYEAIKKTLYDASHNCFSYRISENEFRYSDDGEPSGTAGKPIFQILEGKNLFEVLIVVTRYFGGTKLGTGGLIRAYSEAAKAGLDQAKIIHKIIYKKIKIIVRYENLRETKELVSKHKGEIEKADYSEKITLMCKIPESKLSAFQKESMHNLEITET